MADDAGKISKQFARDLAEVLRWARPQMRSSRGATPQTRKFSRSRELAWGRLKEDVTPGDAAKRCLLHFQDINDGGWLAGTTDVGTPGTEGYIPNDVVLVDDNLLETGETLTEGTWVVLGRNPQTGRWQIINWQGCPS